MKSHIESLHHLVLIKTDEANTLTIQYDEMVEKHC